MRQKPAMIGVLAGLLFLSAVTAAARPERDAAAIDAFVQARLQALGAPGAATACGQITE